MKTRSTTWFIVLIAVTLAFLGTLPAFAAEDSVDPVTIERDRILVPGSNFSDKDKREMNAILAQYDKALYKLKDYDKGKAAKPRGTLKDSAIDKATAARAAVHAKDKRFVGSTLQIGFTSNQDISGRTTNQDIGGQTTNQDIGRTSNQEKTTHQNYDNSSASADPRKKSRELVKRLTPILRKYSKAQSAR